MQKSNKYIFLFFLNFFFLIIGFAQTKDEQIKSIRKKFELINKDTALIKVVFENGEFLTQMTDNGGKLIGYYKNGEIKKIYEWIGLSNGINIKEFYFDNAQLIFVYEKFDMFKFNNKKNEFDFSKTKTIFEGRYYFKNKDLFSSWVKGKKSLAGQPDSTDKDLLESADYDLVLLNRKAN